MNREVGLKRGHPVKIKRHKKSPAYAGLFLDDTCLFQGGVGAVLFDVAESFGTNVNKD